MRICDLRIEKFRGIKSGRVRFGRHGVLVGPNNAGKTTVIEALVLLFGRDRLVRDLTEHDFYGSSPQAMDRIRIIATITGFEPNDASAHRDWFRDGRAVEKWYDAETGDLHADKTADRQSLAMQVGFSARFDRESLEVETVRYFHDDDAKTDPFDEEGVPPLSRSLVADLGFFLVPASRTWDAVISFGSELFRRVVESEKAKPFETVIGERDRLRAPAAPLEQDKAISGIVGNVDQELEGFFPSKPKLRLRVTTTDSQGLLDAVIPHYESKETALPLPARRHGSGLVSLQRILLLLHFGRKRTADGKNFWMALEEPELHVPSSLQRRLVHRLQALTAQTFVTTHSAMVATLADPTTVTFLRNDQGTLSAAPLQAGPLPGTTPNAIRRLFQINRLATIDALMHEVALVPEGRIEKEWLEVLVRAVDAQQGWNPNEESIFGSYVGVVPTESSAVVATWQAVRPIHSRVIPLVDGDKAGRDYAKHLLAESPPPPTILRWKDGWEIEDIVGWVLSANPGKSVPAVNGVLDEPVADIDALIQRLKGEDRAKGGLKQDYVAYEAIGAVLGDISACVDRARALLNAIAECSLGRRTPMFEDDKATPGVKVFVS